MENYLKPKLGQYKIKALSPATIQDFVNGLKLNGLSKGSIEGILSALSGALDYAVEPLHFIQQNPTQYVKIPKIEKQSRERIILDADEWGKIIERFPEGSRFYIPLMIGYYCGLRISETFGLTWDDIDFDNCTLSVNKQVLKRNYGVDVRALYKEKGKKEERSTWYFSSPKTRSSFRTIKFGDTLNSALKTEYIRQKKNELLYGEYFTIHVIKTEYDEKNNEIRRIIPIQKCVDTTLPRVNMVCIDDNGELTTPDTFKYASRVIHHELGLAFDYHSLRHTHATLLIENGANPKAVQERLGHQNIETTMQTYVHNTEKLENDAVDIFENAVRQ